MNPNPIERQAFTIKEFCKRNSIAPSTFYKLKAKDRAPRIMDLGGTVRITLQAEQAWQAEREKPDDTEQRLLRRQEKSRADRSIMAAKKSAASPNHVSKRKTKR